MAVNITMPKWGLTMKEGKITRWLKKEGDSIEKGEDLFEVETEKITNKVESPASGILFQIVAPAGSKMPVTAVVGILAEPGEKPERVEGVQMGEAVEAPVPAAGEAKQTPSAVLEPKKFVPASPAARRLAKEMDIDLSLVKGSGPDGRVTETDVNHFHEQGPPTPKITPLAEEIARQAGLDIAKITGTGDGGKITKEDVDRALEIKTPQEAAIPEPTMPFTGMRKAIADNMHASLQNTAQLTAFTEVDVTEMVRFRDLVRKEYKTDESVKVSYNDIIIMATARALTRFPIMNAAQVGEEIILNNAVHLGIAVALDGGLIVPKLRDADQKTLLQIAGESRDLARKAREGTLSVDEVTGGTFTISNVSMLGMDGFTPILNPPETGILGIGRIIDKPAIHKGEIGIRTMMTLSLTFDHRVVDGAPAMAFLQVLAGYLEHPVLIMA